MIMTYAAIIFALTVTAWVLISDADSDIESEEEPQKDFDNFYNNNLPHI